LEFQGLRSWPLDKWGALHLTEGSSPSGDPSSDAASNLSIGNFDTTGPRTFDGLIGGVRIYNRALSPDEIKRLYIIGAAGKLGVAANNDSLAKGLVGYWNFDGKTVSGTRLFDASGTGNYGTMTNGPKLVYGKIGQGVEFDGADDYVDRDIETTSSLWMGTQDWAISGWVKFSNPNNGLQEGILGTWNDQNNYWYVR
jgi:hypothetical protein